jgi:protein-tyrosine phosphatase
MTPTGNALLPGLTVRPATPADAAAFVALHEDAARWLWERGIHQWRPGTFQLAWILEPIARGAVYLAERDSAAVGTVMIEWRDAEVWPDDRGDAGYIHGLRVPRSAAGQGIGLALLRWAERQIAAAGKRFARLDCIAANPVLRAYYERAGYTLKGVVMDSDGSGGLARFEKHVGDL